MRTLPTRAPGGHKMPLRVARLGKPWRGVDPTTTAQHLSSLAGVVAPCAASGVSPPYTGDGGPR